ncbi:hypothetical protein ABZ816_23305 [Actinosynnema sp. NPDC047251]|uniref:Uncharacterized protein n=1 Tax=Saccharothrix espanaensis (strain ATCC 51144 / DSM 44229 / JCM 9112 / NBRC 15066 / NRRL 15764) TaxID=1179773 RepID=K0K7M9_SACES|nr:hypothetical protein [Saccharothrix espanaensis]CCH32603.1 hypothetical protein BN6_53400 [Saccharothrix espanaensis DSM 44229]
MRPRPDHAPVLPSDTPEARRRARGEGFRAKAVEWAALLISLVALAVSLAAWTRPYPADPRSLPRYGDPKQAVVIADVEQALGFFTFLDDERESRVFLNISIPTEVMRQRFRPHGDAQPGDEPYRDGFVLPDDHLTYVLSINKAGEPDRRGMYFAHGAYNLNGYFANRGIIDISTGAATVSITPLTDLEALGP